MLNRMILIACVLTIALAPDVEACRHRRRRIASCPPPAAYARPVAPTVPAYYVTPPMPAAMPAMPAAMPMPQAAVQRQPAPVATTAMPATGSGNAPGAFLAWLNGVRGQYGLPPVGYSPDLEAWAAANNTQQAASGLGHYTLGPARMQNAAMGAPESVGGMWMNSAPHRATLLSPSITRIGIAWNGSFATLNAD